MFHHITAVAAVSSLTTANGFLTVAAGLTDSDLSSLNVSPNFSFFPFMELVQNMVGPMQQYSGTVFIWCALATMILGSSMAIVKFFATQALF